MYVKQELLWIVDSEWLSIPVNVDVIYTINLSFVLLDVKPKPPGSSLYAKQKTKQKPKTHVQWFIKIWLSFNWKLYSSICSSTA